MSETSKPLVAAGFVLSAAALVAGTMLLAKVIGSGAIGAPLPPFLVSFARFFFALIALTTAVIFLDIPKGRIHWVLHLARSLFGWGSATLLFSAAVFIPLSDASAISFSNPLFALILSCVILKERLKPWRIASALIGFVGALILVRPGSEAFQPAALLALGAAICMGCEVIAIKLLSEREAPLQILLINNLIGTCIAGAVAIFVWQTPTLPQWIALAGVGVLMVMAQALFIQALKRADASYVSPFWYATLVFAGLYDFISYHTVPDRISIIGAFIVLGSGAVLAWRETIHRHTGQLTKTVSNPS